MKFSQWVLMTREAQNLSQTECAKRIGISQPSWQEYETADRPKLKKTVERIADALGVKRDEALEAAGFIVDTPDIPAEWARLWLSTPADRREKLMKATRGVQEAIATF